MTKINLKKNLAFSSSSQFITIIASFIVNVFLSRFLGPDLRGRYVYLFTINAVVWSLLDLGITKSFVYSLQHYKTDPRKLYNFSLVFFGFSLVLATIFFYFLVPLIPGLREQHYSKLILVALGTYIASYVLFARQKSIFMGLDRINEYAVLSFFPTVAFMVLLVSTFWLVPVNLRMEYAYLLNVSTFLISLLIFHFKLGRHIKLSWNWDFPLIRRSYFLGQKAFLSEYLIILMTRIDQLILKQLGTFAQLGVYSLAVNFVDMINTVCNVFGVVLLSKFTSLNNDTESLAILRKIFILITAFNLVCITGMVVLGSFLIRYIYGPEYIGAYTAFLLLIPSIFGLTMGALFNTFLWSKGFPVFTILAPIIPILLKTVSSYFLIPHYGYMGAAITSSLCYPLWFLILVVWYFTTHRDQKLSQLIPQKQDFLDSYRMFLGAKSKVFSMLGI